MENKSKQANELTAEILKIKDQNTRLTSELKDCQSIINIKAHKSVSEQTELEALEIENKILQEQLAF